MSDDLSDEIAAGIVSAIVKVIIAVAAGLFLFYGLLALVAFHDLIPAAIGSIWEAIVYAAKSTAKLIGILVLAGLVLFWVFLKFIDIMDWRTTLRKPGCIDKLDPEDANTFNSQTLPTSIEEDSIRIGAIRRMRNCDAKTGPQ